MEEKKVKRLIESREILCKCRYCGGYFPLFENVGLGDYELVIPKVLAPTMDDLKIKYNRINGCSYEENTGNKIEDNFVSGMREIFHTSEEDDDKDGVHSLGWFECWCEII